MNYIILDLEATCEENDRTYPKEIIEIGAVKLNAALEVVDTFESFVNPSLTRTLTTFCTELTSITTADVTSAPKFSEVCSQFREWIGEDYVLISWGAYDRNQLEKDCRQHNLSSEWVKPHIDLKRLHHKVILNGEGRPMGMKGALRHSKIKLEGTHHRGIDDAKNIAKIFKHHYKEFTAVAFNN